MHKKSIFSLILGAASCVVITVLQVSASSLPIEWSTIGSSTRWLGVATTQQGEVVYATSGFIGNPQAYPGEEKIMKSVDSGTTWTDVTPSSLYSSLNITTIDWLAIDASPSGQIVTAVGTPSVTRAVVVRSIDGGTTWSTIDDVSVTSGENAMDIVMSDDGQMIVVGYRASNARWSRNGGATFRETLIEQAAALHDLEMSSDGGVVYAPVDGGGAYRSYDQGATWARVPGLVGPCCDEVSMSADGKILIATGYADAPGDGQFYISRDSGETWATNTEVSRFFISSALPTYHAMSNDGLVMVAGSYNGEPQVSTDYGVTWSRFTGPTSSLEVDGEKRHYITDAAVSGTGSRIYLVGSGYLYLGDPPILRGIVDVPVVETIDTVMSPTTVFSTVTTTNTVAKANTLPTTGESSTQMLLVIAAIFVIAGVGLRLRRVTRP